MREKNQKRNIWIVWIVIVAVFLTLLPFGAINAKAADTSLKKSDFTFTYKENKKTVKIKFLSASKYDDAYYYYFVARVKGKEASKYVKDKSSDYKSARGISMGSSATAVMKKYGKTKEIDFEASERLAKVMTYGCRSIDTSDFDSYLEYGGYKKKGIEGLCPHRFGGNHRNMSYEEEEKMLNTFKEKAEAGELVTAKEIQKEYEKRIGHKIRSHGQIYKLLKRHGWRKIKLRPKHPKKASAEEKECG